MRNRSSINEDRVALSLFLNASQSFRTFASMGAVEAFAVAVGFSCATTAPANDSIRTAMAAKVRLILSSLLIKRLNDCSPMPLRSQRHFLANSAVKAFYR